MKKFLICSAILIALLSSCSTTSFTTEAGNIVSASTSYSKKTVGKYGDPKPSWITADISTNDIHFAVGAYNLPVETDARKLAIVEAKNVLAEWVATSVREQVKASNSSKGKTYEIVTQQTAEATLRGVIQVDEWVDKDGTVYVLLGLPVDQLEEW